MALKNPRFGHGQTAMTAESLALISNTEEQASQSVPVVHSALAFSREFDQAGQPVARRFTCSAQVFGRTISSTAGTTSAAENLVRRQVKMLGYELVETAIQDIPDEEPEAPAVDTEEETTTLEINGQLAVVKISDLAAVKAALGLSDEPEPVVEDFEGLDEPADPFAYLYSDVEPELDNGQLTPASDPRRWTLVYEAAWQLATGARVWELNLAGRKPEELGFIRGEVSALMTSGVAGSKVGCNCSAVSPWATTPNGKPWRTYVQGCPDPTIKSFRAGSGSGREAFYKTLSGLPAFPEENERVLTAKQWRLERAASRYDGSPKAGKTAMCTRVYEETVQLAHKAGQAAKNWALLKGATPKAASLQYKLAYCNILRAANQAPHRAFEAILEAEGLKVA